MALPAQQQLGQGSHPNARKEQTRATARSSEREDLLSVVPAVICRRHSPKQITAATPTPAQPFSPASSRSTDQRRRIRYTYPQSLAPVAATVPGQNSTGTAGQNSTGANKSERGTSLLAADRPRRGRKVQRRESPNRDNAPRYVHPNLSMGSIPRAARPDPNSQEGLSEFTTISAPIPPRPP